MSALLMPLQSGEYERKCHTWCIIAFCTLVGPHVVQNVPFLFFRPCLQTVWVRYYLTSFMKIQPDSVTWRFLIYFSEVFCEGQNWDSETCVSTLLPSSFIVNKWTQLKVVTIRPSQGSSQWINMHFTVPLLYINKRLHLFNHYFWTFWQYSSFGLFCWCKLRHHSACAENGDSGPVSREFTQGWLIIFKWWKTWTSLNS
jgi:hypothetical protein